jgi:hypothetical protein
MAHDLDLLEPRAVFLFLFTYLDLAADEQVLVEFDRLLSKPFSADGRARVPHD